ncbi:hypothetical protein [Sphingomonas oryzagri]
MHIIAARKRISGMPPLHEYRLVVPFGQLPANRAALIATRSDYGIPGGPHARLRDVIAPIDWLRMKPCPEKHALGRDIDRVAQHLEAAFLTAVYPELTARPVPLLVPFDGDLDDCLVEVAINEITDGYRFLRNADPAGITAERFHLAVLPEREAL